MTDPARPLAAPAAPFDIVRELREHPIRSAWGVRVAGVAADEIEGLRARAERAEAALTAVRELCEGWRTSRHGVPVADVLTILDAARNLDSPAQNPSFRAEDRAVTPAELSDLRDKIRREINTSVLVEDSVDDLADALMALIAALRWSDRSFAYRERAEAAEAERDALRARITAVETVIAGYDDIRDTCASKAEGRQCLLCDLRGALAGEHA